MKVLSNFFPVQSLKQTIMPVLHEQHKRIIAIAALALGLLGLAYVVCRYYHRTSSPKNDSKKVTDTLNPGKSYCYILTPSEMKRVGKIEDKSLFGKMVENLPICCVDIFLFDPKQQAYFLVQRRDPPAKGFWWVPGGRLEKGESFFGCARRKCLEEIKLKVTTKEVLGVANTFFPDSNWNLEDGKVIQTHTVNVYVLALLKEGQANPVPDPTIVDWRWEKIEVVPKDPYIKEIYNEAVKKLGLSIN